jgi:hypothetical protein
MKEAIVWLEGFIDGVWFIVLIAMAFAHRFRH